MIDSSSDNSIHGCRFHARMLGNLRTSRIAMFPAICLSCRRNKN